MQINKNTRKKISKSISTRKGRGISMKRNLLITSKKALKIQKNSQNY